MCIGVRGIEDFEEPENPIFVQDHLLEPILADFDYVSERNEQSCVLFRVEFGFIFAKKLVGVAGLEFQLHQFNLQHLLLNNNLFVDFVCFFQFAYDLYESFKHSFFIFYYLNN